MIALLLAAQLSGALPVSPDAQIFSTPPALRSQELIRSLPRKAVCKGEPGRLEAALIEPTALYRKGDRPAKGFKRWADYPDGVVCAVGAGP